MPVGIDFDNTIVRYDRVFAEAARARGWVAADFQGSKKALRDAVRLLPDGEIKWQILQGEVYGSRMGEAEPFPGVFEFIASARQQGVMLHIVSHKTRYSNYGEEKTDLRVAALAWMEKNGFFDPAKLGFSREQIFFADTRAEKIARIAALGCDAFIDDLEEVFGDPAFPSGVTRVLFTEGEPPDDLTVVARRSWSDIARLVLNEGTASKGSAEEDAAAGARLAGAALRSVQPARSGGNNRLFRIETVEGKAFALKFYPRQASDRRDRLATEFGALTFLRRHGIAEVPAPIAKDAESGFALYQWIDGEPTQADSLAVDEAVKFIGSLRELRDTAGAESLPPASEACFSAQSIVDQVEARLSALGTQAAAHQDLGAFVTGEFAPIMDRTVKDARRTYTEAELDFAEPLDSRLRTLSPSDFGFHNALRRADGRIVFLDFEYFGWDDPVKLTSDFVLHPGMDLTAELKRRFLDSMSGVFWTDQTFAARLRASLPLYALRWTMILLNEFLPERWERRVMAGVGDDRAAILKRQLAKARTMLARAQSGTLAA